MSSLNYFNLFFQVVSTELASLTEFVNEVSDDLLTKQEKLENSFLSAQSQAESDEEFQDIHSAFESEADRYFKTFPVYTYNPILLSLYGLLESWLKELCDFDTRSGFSKLTISDLAGFNYIDKSRRYLALIAEVDLTPVDILWDKITFYQKIRNCIAHHNSHVAKGKMNNISGSELYKQLKQDKSVHLDDSNGFFYIKEKLFILEAIDTIHAYLKYITYALSNKRVVAKNTTMPYNNTGWGQEKTHNLLQDIIRGINIIERNKVRLDIFKEDDFNSNMQGLFCSMAYDLTKLFAFFCDGTWQPSHRDILIQEKDEGLAKLSTIYKEN